VTNAHHRAPRGEGPDGHGRAGSRTRSRSASERRRTCTTSSCRSGSARGTPTTARRSREGRADGSELAPLDERRRGERTRRARQRGRRVGGHLLPHTRMRTRRTTARHGARKRSTSALAVSLSSEIAGQLVNMNARDHRWRTPSPAACRSLPSRRSTAGSRTAGSSLMGSNGAPFRRGRAAATDH